MKERYGSSLWPAAPVRMAVATVGGAQQTEIVGFGAAAERERKDVIDLNQAMGTATARADPVDVAAATPIALPDLPLDCDRNGAVPYLGRR